MSACHDTVLLSFQLRNFLLPMIIAGSNCYGWILLVYFTVTVVSGFVGKAPKVTFRRFVLDKFVLGVLGLIIRGGGSGLEQVLGTNNHGFILTHAGFVHDTGSS